MISKRRIRHVIRSNERCVYPSQVVYVDTETNLIPVDDRTIQQDLFFGVAQYRDYAGHHRNDEIVFHQAGEFWDWLISKCQPRKKLYCIAHNQDFDFRVLRGFTELPYRGLALKSLIADGGKWIVEYVYKKIPPVDEPEVKSKKPVDHRYSIIFLDTLNWFHSSLASLGETIGVPKLPMPSQDAPMEQWIEYCRRDVDVLRLSFENYIKFLREMNMGNFGFTLAKQALNAYRHRFMQHDIQVHTQRSATELERRAYFGGRTECFYIGKITDKLFYKLDINSQYPYVMRTYPYPCALIGIRSIRMTEWEQTHEGEYVYIADCDVETTKPCIPYRHNHRLCFPVGSFSTTLCEPEIRLAEEMGASVQIRKIAYYKQAYLFRDWVDSMYAMRNQFRKEKNDQYQYFTKLLMNSLYGKFGQRTEEWMEIGECDSSENWYRTFVDADSEHVRICKAVGGKIYQKNGWKEGWDTCVFIAAFVCSYARSYLWRLIHQAGVENVYYCDTDSLLVNSVGYERLKDRIDPTRLGYLKLEQTDDHIQIYNLKDYEFANEVKIKGINRKAVKIGEDTYLCEQWEHLTGAIHHGRAEAVMVKKLEKIMKREYHKGVVCKDGRVIPFHISDGHIQSV